MNLAEHNPDYLDTAQYLASRYPNYGTTAEWYQWVYKHSVTAEMLKPYSGLQIVRAFKWDTPLPGKQNLVDMSKISNKVNERFEQTLKDLEQ